MIQLVNQEKIGGCTFKMGIIHKIKGKVVEHVAKNHSEEAVMGAWAGLKRALARIWEELKEKHPILKEIKPVQKTEGEPTTITEEKTPQEPPQESKQPYKTKKDTKKKKEGSADVFNPGNWK